MKAVTVLLSGGIDSLVCAHILKKEGYELKTLFVDYGQKAALHEKTSTIYLSDYLGSEHKEINLINGKNWGGGEIPFRNALLIFIGCNQLSTKLLATGIHSGTPYYDCSKPFIRDVKNIISSYTGGKTQLVCPLEEWSKAAIFIYAKDNSLPIDKTYSCEKGTMPTCGACLSCRDVACMN